MKKRGNSALFLPFGAQIAAVDSNNDNNSNNRSNKTCYTDIVKC